MPEFYSMHPKYSASREHREETFTPIHEVPEEPLWKVLAQLGDVAIALSLTWATCKRDWSGNQRAVQCLGTNL